MTYLIGIYGASGAGRGIAPIAKDSFSDDQNIKIIFIDDNKIADEVNGYSCFNFQEFLDYTALEKRVSIAIADSQIRKALVQKCQNAGISFATIIAKNSIVMDDVEIGEGSLISPFCCITSNICIGKHFHANIGSIVEHDCIIGDYVTFAPGVRCNGNIHIGDHAYIGSGAIIKQGTPDNPLRIGKRAIVGMGAVVTKDVSDGAVVIGNPARPMK